MPPKISHFDYLVPENLKKEIKVGQLVEVPFRSGNEYGLVHSLDQKTLLNSKTKLRYLNRICFSNCFLPDNTSYFFKEISEFYGTDLGFIYKFSLPKFTKKFIASLTSADFPLEKTKRETEKPQTIVLQNEKHKDDFLNKILSNSAQHLILVPEKSDIAPLYENLKKVFPIEILSSEITDKNTTALWRKIRHGENIVIIGTRKALFLPWTNLKTITIIDEGNENYKSFDMAPRYHTRDAALLLSSFCKCAVYLVSHTPSVSSFYFSKQKIYNIVGEPTKIKNSFKIIDLNLEKRAKNYSPLSFELSEELKGLQRNESAFLFLNKKGSAGYLFCGDCKKPFVCSTCGRPLSYFASKKELRCNFCETVQPLFDSCPNCQSLNMKMRNPGTESVEKELRKEKALQHFQIVRLDSENEENYSFVRKPGTIYIGTEMAWGLIPWREIKLVGFLNTDSSLVSSEYKNLEHLWQKIRDSFYKSDIETKIILQTSHPDHYLFSALNEPNIFYENQLKERSLFQYPPFNFWLKIAILSPNANSAIREATDLKNRLSSLTNSLKNAKISGPHQATPFLQKGKYRYILLIRLGYENYRSSVKEINKLIPNNWKIDPNPNTLLSV